MITRVRTYFGDMKRRSGLRLSLGGTIRIDGSDQVVGHVVAAGRIGRIGRRHVQAGSDAVRPIPLVAIVHLILVAARLQ